VEGEDLLVGPSVGRSASATSAPPLFFSCCSSFFGEDGWETCHWEFVVFLLLCFFHPPIGRKLCWESDLGVGGD